MGMPPLSIAKAITRVMKPEAAASGPSPVWRTQGARRPWARSDSNVLWSQSRLDCTTAAPKAARPRRPRPRYADSARPAPAADHSSVPSTPNTSSAWPPTSAMARPQASPSAAACRSSSSALASVLVARNASSPSGKSVPVGCSVLRYSRPRAVSSSPSSACAGPPTHSGCHALKTSWRKPGSVSSAVLIAPPSSSSRSSTQTSQPARARKAAHASELMPLPTMTASCSATCEFPELLVGDDVALLRAEILHPRKELALSVLRQVEAELSGLDADRVDAALLPEYDPPLCAHDLGRVGLDRRRVVELSRDRARLASKEVLADERLVGLERIPGQLAQTFRERAHPFEAQVRLDAVEPAQRKRNLGQACVARTLPHAVDRSVDPASAGTRGRDGRGGGETEVVVTVEVDRYPWPEPVARTTYEVGGCFRSGDPERVDHGNLLRARLDGRLVDRLEVRWVCARPVDAEERHGDALVDRERDRVDDAFQHRLAVDAERLELQVGDRRLNHARTDPELDECLDVRLHGPRETPDLGGEPGIADQLDGAPIVRGDAREPGLDPLDPELVEAAGELELVLGTENDTDGLLPVTQSRVVEADLGLERVRLVDPAGPERHRKSSG